MGRFSIFFNKKYTKMGFYYNQPGFYYNQPGFYYNQQQQDGGFYYDGFYYEQQQEEDQQDGFYYDEVDKFNKDNKDYWAKGDGKDRMIKALNGLRTQVDHHVTKDKTGPNATQGRALSNVIVVEVVREVIRKFVKNVDPDAYFEAGGDAKKLATLLAKECQSALGAEKDFRKDWREEGSDAKKAMDKVTKSLVPFMVTWTSKQGFKKPNAIQDAALMKVVAERLVDEVFYGYAVANSPANINADNMKQVTFDIAKKLADVGLGRIEKEIKESA